MSLPPPQPDEIGEPFWEAAARGELQIQACAACGAYRHPPAPICAQCHSTTIHWRAIEPEGEMYSYVITRHPIHRSLAGLVPLTTALVEVAAGPRIYALWEGESEPVIGQRVALAFADHDGTPLTVCRPA
jgi:uncharacterized OB-fold protein